MDRRVMVTVISGMGDVHRCIDHDTSQDGAQEYLCDICMRQPLPHHP